MSSQATDPQRQMAAIYARVSSDRQRQEQTIDSQVAELRELAAQRGLVIAEELVFCDDGVSGANLKRPALELLRDHAAEGAFEVLLCHSPDRLARRYVYQVLLLEELERCGVEVCFAREGERADSPEDELLRQFQGMIAEYERAQIAERTRRGKLHRARQGYQSALSTAPYGYRYVKKTETNDGYFKVDPVQAEVVREIFRRYTEEGESISAIARWLTWQGMVTAHGKRVWERSTVWGILHNTAYRGQAAFGKTRLGGPTKVTRVTRMRGERSGKYPARTERPPEEWTFIPVPAIITDEQFELAQKRLEENKRFAPRNTKEPTLLQGMLVCGHCGYAMVRSSSRGKSRRLYYRCTGASGGLRYSRGKVCGARQIRAEELDEAVWGQVTRLISEPELIQGELERRLYKAQNDGPANLRAEVLEQQLTNTGTAKTRLIEAYQDQLLTLEELRERMPALRKREQTTAAQIDALTAELHDSEAYLRLAEDLDGFLSKLNDGLERLTIKERQRLLRLIVREVVVYGKDGKVTIKHSIPIPSPDSSRTPTGDVDRLRSSGVDGFSPRS